MRPVLFELGPLTIYTYGVFVVLAFLAATGTVWQLAKRTRLSLGHLTDYALYGALAGLLGARLGYLLLRPDEIGSFWGWFAIGGGRLLLFSGLVVGLIVVTSLLRQHRTTLEQRWRWLDVIAIGVLVGLAVGRFGSYLNGDYLGTVTGVPWGVSYTGDTTLIATKEQLHPLSLYAAVLYAGAAAYGYRLWKLRPAASRPGLVFWTSLFLVGAIQVVLEPWHAASDALLVGSVRSGVLSGLLLMAVSGWVVFKRYPQQVKASAHRAAGAVAARRDRAKRGRQ